MFNTPRKDTFSTTDETEFTGRGKNYKAFKKRTMIAVHNMSKLLSSLILCIKVLFLRVIDKLLRPQICQRNINTRKQLVTLNVSVGVNMGAMLRYTSHGSSKKYVDIFLHIHI